MRRVMILFVVVLLAVAAAGCGGGDDEGAAETDTVAVTETTTDETTTDETTTEEADTSDSGDLGGLASGDCRELAQAGQALENAIAAAGTSGDLGDASEEFQQFVDKAPEEIRADVQILADAYAKYADALKDVDLQTGETPSAQDLAKLTEAMEAVDQAQVTAASQRLSTWATEHCTTD